MNQFNEDEISLIIKSEAIIGNLYLGNYKSLEEENLQNYQIGAVLNVQDDIKIELQNRLLKQLAMKDSENEDISKYQKECHVFIEDNLKFTNVLISSKAGRSRSAAITISYLIQFRHWNYDQAFEYVKSKRAMIQPNQSFESQLEKYGDKFYTWEKSEISLVLENKDKSKGNLFLGSINSLDFIKPQNIRAVLSLMTEFKPKIEGNIKHLNLVYGDMPRVQICQAFKQTNLFIEENLKETNVLVHCMGGVSRSSTIVIAYLMYSLKLPFNDAFKFVLDRRPFINPNEGFVVQLKKYQYW